jgi:methyl-accepting chemotaxis protein
MNKMRDAILLVLLLVLLTAGVLVVDNRYRQAQATDVVAQFQLLSTLRLSALEAYFDTARAEVAFWSTSERIDNATRALSAGWQALGSDAGAQLQDLYSAEQNQPAKKRVDAGDGSAYSTAHASLHDFAREFVTGRGYYDFFLIDLNGNVLYTVEKEADFGSNLLTGPYADSGLADAFRQAAASTVPGQVVLSDLQRYAPSDNAPAIFAATTLRDEAGKTIGVLALQLPSDTIATIMQFTEGMGESGETYLVGSDLLMRSNSRFAEQSTILTTSVATATVERALAGESGVDYTDDYRGIEVLSAYDSIEFDGVRWAVMAEIDKAEIERGVGSILASLAAAALALFGLVIVTVATLRDTASADHALAGSTDIDIDAG